MSSAAAAAQVAGSTSSSKAALEKGGGANDYLRLKRVSNMVMTSMMANGASGTE